MIALDIYFRFGNLCVDVDLWSIRLAQFKGIAAVFDTGAHTTHVDTNVLKNLGYDLKNAGVSYVSTVGNNNLKINNTIIDNIQIGDFKTGAVLVNFSELSDISFPVIIGLNVIKEFDVNLDFTNMKMLLRPNFDTNSIISVEHFNKHGSRFGLWNVRGL